MTKTKSIKLFVLSMIFVLSSVLGFVFTPNSVVFAETVSGATYFASTNFSSPAVFEDDLVKAPLKNGDVLTVKKSKLVIDKFSTEINFPQNAKSISLSFTSPSYIVTGNPKTDGGETTYETTVVNTLVLTDKGSNVSAKWNDGVETDLSATAGDDTFITVKVTEISEGLLSCEVDGIDLGASSDLYYLVDSLDKPIADVSFTALTEDSFTDPVNFAVKSISQNYDNDDYKQTFELDGDNLKNTALPRITLNDSFFTSVGVNNILNGKLYTVNPSLHSVAGGEVLSNYKLTVKDGELDGDIDKFFIYDKTASSLKFFYSIESDADYNDIVLSFRNFGDTKDVETYNVRVYNEKKNGLGIAPAFIDIDENELNQASYDSFVYALDKATKIEEDVTDDGGNTSKVTHSIALGSSQKLTVPSMKSIIKDNITSYENLSKQIFYSDSEESSSTNDLTIPVKHVGQYKFYAIFTDENSNATPDTDFVDNSDNFIEGDFLFGFYLLDDANLTVKASVQGEGYKGVKYTASDFKISASSYTSKYALYYSANEIDADAEGWKEIVKVSDATDTNKSYNGYSYDAIKSIGYDGDMTFTPNKLGYYKIVCTITSTATQRYSTDSAIIKVVESTAVHPDSHWLENNVWSVVFLSVGGLSLIGIVVLLFVKPKDEKGKSKNK